MKTFSLLVLILFVLVYCAAEREAVNAAERAERKQQLRDKVSAVFLCFFFAKVDLGMHVLVCFSLIEIESCDMGLLRVSSHRRTSSQKVSKWRSLR